MVGESVGEQVTDNEDVTVHVTVCVGVWVRVTDAENVSVCVGVCVHEADGDIVDDSVVVADSVGVRERLTDNV